ncbi:hypothetical protein BBJ33_05965 [Bacillus velezensis]|uniref:hypothetical protein n=1 Tax=Bacillus velezensis TaxID=492670 RepID=UPI00084A0EB7|nr:hypothetical protein [Bacillus velezensis]AOO61087.1 hypothetical protein BBJ33_05965 [Bacillus velezensis]QHM89768.1 hypothetical protein DXY21_03843 [Bacillus velezensis]
MAKLDGVKTLDMVNGEITKVAYGGAEYVKTEGLPKENDLVMSEEGGYDITCGAFYKITEDADHEEDVRFLDDVDDGRVRDADDYVLFRKVSASTDPSLEERVSSAEGEIESLKSDVAALKGEAGYVRIDKSEAQEGDYIKFDEAPRSYLTAGEYYEIDYVDSHGDPQITDDDGDEFDTYSLDHCEFEVYRKVSAASVEAERLKVGDYAKVVGQAIVTEKGEIVKVIQDTGAIIPFKVETMDGKYTEWRSEASLVRATDEEVAEAKDTAARAKFKRGDKVRLLSGGGDYPLSGFENDKIYEVLYNNFNHPKGKRIRIADSTERFGYATPDQLEILSEEEAAEIERKQAEEAKWAKIGRKVGEYKKGDIAKLTIRSGDIFFGEITGLRGGNYYGFKHLHAKYGTASENTRDLTLITPVEARFDR